MAKYLFIESRDPFEHRDVEEAWNLAAELSDKGDDVIMFLVQNAVFASRKNARVNTLQGGKVTVYADDLSLAERGIGADSLREGVTPASVDQLTDFIMEDGRKPIWM
jgi:sulfur relay (sulfurtransferase) DsrF/TusC family protein